MKNTLLLAFGILCVTMVRAEIPTNYYSLVKDGQKADAIYSNLHSAVNSGKKVLSYDDLEDYYEPIDFDKDGYLMDIYSTCELTMADANKSQNGVCDAWNKEHTIPQSWFSGGGGMKSDLFHVYPTDACVNGTRSNYPYGENAETGLGLKSGKDPDHHGLGSMGTNTFGGYSVGKVYEPDDQFKGDIARNYFYMVTCYAYSSFTSSDGSKMFTSTGFTEFALKLLLKWHRQDPVSQKEIDRNNGVYKVQKNRNPFIDYPYLVEYIWGDKKGQAFDWSQIISSEDPSFIPGESNGWLESTEPLLRTNDTVLVFPTLLEGQSSTLTCTAQAYRMTHGISCTIIGKDASQYSVTPLSIDASKATGTHTFTVTYQPTEKAIHTASLVISSDEANTLTIPLSGACATECEVMWLVDGEETTAGDPTTSVVMGGKITQLPTAPTSCSEVSPQFVGWTQTPIADTTDVVLSDLFSDVKEAPASINNNTTFHAVFARLTEVKSTTPKELKWTNPSTAGWTVNKTKSTNGYQVLISDASITSPEVDLAGLQSITVSMRTYGGTQYGTIKVQANGTTICSLVASSSTMADKTWTNTGSLKGTYPLVFSSSTSSSSAGPGLDAITISSEGTKYDYDRFITSCTQATAVENINNNHNDNRNVVKVLREGRLIIQLNESEYNVLGIKTK